MTQQPSNSASKLTVRCPTCDTLVNWGPQSAFRPFCSERCRLIDLGEWANEEKAIPGESLPPTVNPDADKESW